MRISGWSSVVCSSDLYGTFARVLGHYVRDERALTLADAVHRMSGLPATNLGLTDRGFLRPGYFADVVIFDPRTIADHSTFEKPHVYATGVRDVLVKGVQIGRASCRERVGQYGENSGGAVTLNKKTK